ncbi:MAG: ATP-binding protein [Candidatus Binataceae bacterium]
MPLSGLAGHHALIAALESELTRRPSHAYLFYGPRGVGKALVAQGLAHELLCERAPGSEFCCRPENCPTRIAANTTGRSARAGAAAAPRCDCCAACVQVALGVHPDFISVARQANRTDVLIEQVRDLIAHLGVRPARGPRRVALIDDAETLNLPAQNALLKTLEEPPGSTLVFVITESERALLDTVRSRTRPVHFGPLEVADIAAVLTARAGIGVERAHALAQLARGSLGRALALAAGEEPPIKELLAGLSRARSLDFAEIHVLAQEFFAAREQASDNFELIARLLEEMICFKLLRAELTAPSPESATAMAELANRYDVVTLTNLLEAALRAAVAVDAMANPRLQAEQWWMIAAEAFQR